MNKKGQCGLRVGSSACTTPTVMKATKPRPPLAAYSPRVSKVSADSHLHIRNSETSQHPFEQTCCCVCFFLLFFHPSPAATPALKGLTSLCGSRSLSCTDLINNFYQPLAQEISRGWAKGGRRRKEGVVGVFWRGGGGGVWV